jgi:hypothetical protein
VVADRRNHRRLVQELGVDVEEGTLPLRIAPLVVGVVAEEQEEVDGLLVRVVDLEALLDLDRFAGMCEGRPVAERRPQGGLRGGARVAYQPNVRVAILRRLVLVRRGPEALLDGGFGIGSRSPERVEVGLVRGQVDQPGLLVIAGGHRRGGALRPVGLLQIADLLGPTGLVGLATPLDHCRVRADQLQEEPLGRGGSTHLRRRAE